MSFKTIVTLEKPLNHISLIDWNSRVTRLRNVANARIADTVSIRNSTRALINDVRIESSWANRASNDALTDRVGELSSWSKIISKTLQRLEEEIEALRQEKMLTERYLDTLEAPTILVGEVLSERDGRLGSELTYDEPDKEMKNELYILETNRRLLSQHCKKAWEKLIGLEQLRLKIRQAIDNQEKTMRLDSEQLALSSDSTKISFKPDSQRHIKNSFTYDAWLESVKNLKQLAENELIATSVMRDAFFVCREKANSILKAQQNQTEFILRKRIFGEL